MFAAWLMSFGRIVAAAVLNTAAGLQASQTGSGSGSSAPAGSYQSGTWTVDSITSASVQMKTDGSVVGTGDTVTVDNFYAPTTPGIGSSCWVSYAITGTSGGCTVFGGMVAGTRYAMTSSRTLGLRAAMDGDSGTRQFTITHYDAASGGNVLCTNTFNASVG
jgi:hypothetical protein